MNKGETVKVLDHGFLKFIDAMGTDEDVVAAARMSTGRGFVSWEQYWRCKTCESFHFEEQKACGVCNARNNNTEGLLVSGKNGGVHLSHVEVLP